MLDIQGEQHMRMFLLVSIASQVSQDFAGACRINNMEDGAKDCFHHTLHVDVNPER